MNIMLQTHVRSATVRTASDQVTTTVSKHDPGDDVFKFELFASSRGAHVPHLDVWFFH
jgi:hypothetical protein